MTRRLFPLLVLTALLLLPGAALAQDEPPDVIDRALADLSERLGAPVTLAQFAIWNWAEAYYPDTSLGCPAPDAMYAQVQTRAYRFILTTYDNAVYDYRVSADGNIVVLCQEGQPAPVEPTATPAPGAPAPCDPATDPAYLAPRVAVGELARVTLDGIPSNLRAEPATSGALLVQIPPGGRFEVTDGPACGEEMVWWQVAYRDRTGWVAEGRDEDYYIEPLGPEPLGVANAAQIGRLRAFRHDSPVTAIAFVGDGLAAAGHEDGTVNLWDAAEGAVLAPLAGEGHSAAVSALAAILPDAVALGLAEATPLLASGDVTGVVIVWDPAARSQAARVEAHTGAVTSMAFSADGSMLATVGADGALKLWDTATGVMLLMVDGVGPALSVMFNAAGNLLITGGADGSVTVWGLPE